jgi:membrane-associated protein
MITQKKKLIQYVAIPAIAVLVYLLFLYLYRLSGLPQSAEIILWAEKYYISYGYWVVFIAAIAEGALFVNWYVPGSIVVALGVVFAKTSGLSIVVMLACVIAGFFFTALLNYAMGRFGWYHVFLKLGLKGPLEKVQSKIQDKGLKILFTTYVHPNFGALTATAAGILKLPFGRFCIYSLCSIAVWNSLWTVLFYYFGPSLLRHMNILVIIGGLFVYFMFAKSIKKSDPVVVSIPN